MNFHGSPHQVRQAFDDSQTHSQALGAVAFLIAYLVELIKNERELMVADTAAGIPHFKAYVAARATRQNQNATRCSEFQRVVDEVARQPLQEGRIRIDPFVAWLESKRQTARLSLPGECAGETAENDCQRCGLNVNLNHPRV